jgi:hypothetical protein
MRKIPRAIILGRYIARSSPTIRSVVCPSSLVRNPKTELRALVAANRLG